MANDKIDNINIIEALIEQGCYEESLAFIDNMEANERNTAQINSLSSIIHLYKGDYSAAVLYGRRALMLEPENQEYQFNLGYIYALKGSKKEALSILDKLEMESRDFGLLQEIAAIKQDYLQNHMLMIAYFFPPLSGSGVFRSLKFSKYLPSFGWIPTVISTTKPMLNWNYEDKQMLEEIPECVTVLRVEDRFSTRGKRRLERQYIADVLLYLQQVLCTDQESREQYTNLLKTEEGIKALLHFPCQALTWSYDLITFVENHVDMKDFKIIYTTSGPYSSHLAGYYLKQKYNIPWVADFRDEWTNNPYMKREIGTPLDKLYVRMEQNVLDYANAVITVAKPARQNYLDSFHILPEKIFTITNGYDEEDFLKIPLSRDKNSTFKISFCGLIYSEERNLHSLFKAVRELISEGNIPADHIEICIMGASNIDNEKIAQTYELQKNIKLFPYGSHEGALRLCLNSDLLICPIGDDKKYNSVIPGKIFEYLRSGKPILVLGWPKGNVAEMIESSHQGHTKLSSDISGIKYVIESEYTKWHQTSENKYFVHESTKQYERKILTAQLACLFDERLQC